MKSGNPSDPDSTWLDSAWTYRVMMTVSPDSIEGTGTLSGFPLLVLLDDSSPPGIFSRARVDGGDLVFTEGDGKTVLDHELVAFDPDSRHAEIWVRLATMSRTRNRFYVYYGNPDAPPGSSPEVWADYTAVYHFQEDPSLGTLRDSSPRHGDALAVDGLDGTWAGSDLVGGQVGRGWYYDGGVLTRSKAISVPGNSWTVSAWLELEGRSTDFFMQTSPCFWHLSAQASDVSWSPQYETSTCGRLDTRWMSNQVVVNEWHHWLWAFDGPDSTISLYYDGDFKPVDSIWPGPPDGLSKWAPHSLNGGGDEWVGILGPMFANGSDEMDGIGDEFRVRSGIPSPDRVKTEYRNQNTPQGFLSFGFEESERTEP